MRKNTQVPQPSGSTENVVDEVVYNEWGNRLVRATTTASSLEAEKSVVPRYHGDTIAQTRFENVSKFSNDSLLTRGHTLQSGDDRMKLNELIELCTNLQSRVLDLEKTKTTQALEITSLKGRVKKLKKKQRSITHKLKKIYKVGLTARVDSLKDKQSLSEDASKQRRKINDIDADEDITLVNDQDDVELFNVNNLHGEEVSAAGKVNASSIATTFTATAIITTEEITLAQALMEIKTSRPKAKGIDKGKGIMVEEPVKLKKKDKIRLDKEAALKLQAELQAEFDKEQRLEKERAKKELEANIALIET
nr:hypothetical protein [Tanacetum cinerariifolium]GEY58059.1 hypothetical protein [Tanacetum cinerariifolium]